MPFNLVQNPDGASFQSQAVLAYVRFYIGDGIEASWENLSQRYLAEPRVTPYDNCREQGYAIFMRSHDHKHQINIAFYEHRNSDRIHAVMNREKTFNAPTLDTITTTMKNSGDTSHSVGFGEACEMAKWIVDQLLAFWEETSVTTEKRG